MPSLKNQPGQKYADIKTFAKTVIVRLPDSRHNKNANHTNTWLGKKSIIRDLDE